VLFPSLSFLESLLCRLHVNTMYSTEERVEERVEEREEKRGERGINISEWVEDLELFARLTRQGGRTISE
jgi:hypothetical protein